MHDRARNDTISMGGVSKGEAAPCFRRVSAAVLATASIWLASSLPARAHPHVWVTVETTVLFDRGSISGFRHKWTFDEFYTSMAVQGLDTNNDGKYSREELAELAKVNIEGLAEFQYFTHAKLGSAPLTFTAPKDYWLEYTDKPADPEADAGKLKPSPSGGILPRANDRTADPAQPPAPTPGFFSRLWSLIFGAAMPGPNVVVASDAPAKVLTLNFTVPLSQPVLSDAPDFNFLVADPSFFIALDLAKTDPIKLGTGAPPTCKIQMAPAEPEDTAKLGDTARPSGFPNQTDVPSFGFSTTQPIKLHCGPRS